MFLIHRHFDLICNYSVLLIVFNAIENVLHYEMPTIPIVRTHSSRRKDVVENFRTTLYQNGQRGLR